MSYPPGPGYWQASDGNWYPPAQPPQTIIVQQERGNGCLIAAVIAAVLVVLVGGCSILIAVTSDAPKAEDKLTIGTELVPATAGQTIRLADDGSEITVANGIVDPSPAKPIPAGTKCVTVKAKLRNDSGKPLGVLILGRNDATAMTGACAGEPAQIRMGPSGTFDLNFSFVVPAAATEIVFTTPREPVIQGEQVGPFAYFKIAA